MGETRTGYAVVPEKQESAAMEIDTVDLLGGYPAMGIFFQEEDALAHLNRRREMFPDSDPLTVVKVMVRRVIPKNYVPTKGLPWNKR